MKNYLRYTFSLMIVLVMCITSIAIAQNQERVNIVLKFLPGVSKHSKNQLFDRFGVEEVDTILGGKVHLLSVPQNAANNILKALSKSKQVEFSELDALHELNVSSNDPKIGSQWYIPKIHAPEAWTYAADNNLPSDIVLVSAPDTGIRETHEDLQNILRMDLSFNTVDNSNNSSPIHSHGTATSGMLSAETDNGKGIASVQWANTAHHIPIRVTNSTNGSAYGSDIAEAVEYATDNGAKVVSVSYSGISGSLRRQAGAYARSLGALFFNSAGNDGGYKDYNGGGNWDEIIAVSSTTSSDALSSFSTYGPFVDLAAPGSSDYTTNYSSDTSYSNASGTSFSSPLAASVAALLFSTYPQATHLQVEQALFQGATDLGAGGWDEKFGHGRVDAQGSIIKLNAILNVSETNPPSVTFSNLTNGDTITENTDINVTASDDTDVDYVELYIDNSLYATDNLDPYILYWDLLNYGDGPHTLEAVAYDVYGNTSSELINVTVDKPIVVAPTIVIISPIEGQCVKGPVVVTTSTTDTQTVDFFKATSLLGTDNTEPFSRSYDFRSKGKPKEVLVRVEAWNAGLSAERSITVVDGGCDGGGNEPKPTKCNDGIDNDKDGDIDYPDDQQCSSLQDNNERR